MTSIRCKFVDGQGEPIGHAEVPPMYGIVNVDGRFYGRMFNGDDDKDKFPFVFADADVLVLAKLEELKYEHKNRKPAGAKLAGTDDVQRASSGRIRRDQLKAKRGRNRGTY